jgi:hypothetical protein
MTMSSYTVVAKRKPTLSVIFQNPSECSSQALNLAFVIAHLNSLASLSATAISADSLVQIRALPVIKLRFGYQHPHDHLAQITTTKFENQLLSRI